MRADSGATVVIIVVLVFIVDLLLVVDDSVRLGPADARSCDAEPDRLQHATNAPVAIREAGMNPY